MERVATITINNCGNVKGWEVARASYGALWHFGTYETEEKARKVAKTLDDAVVVELR